MKIELQVKVPYEVAVTDLEYVPSSADVFKGLDHDAKETSDGTYDGEPMNETTFEEQWLLVVTQAAIASLSTYDQLEGAYVYMGHWQEAAHDGGLEQRAVAIVGKDMDDYGDDIIYTGWRVKVNCYEGTWDYR